MDGWEYGIVVDLVKNCMECNIGIEESFDVIDCVFIVLKGDFEIGDMVFGGV